MLETHTVFEPAEPSSHRVTDIKEAVRNQNRVNVYVDNKFFCSLDIAQVVDLRVKIGLELDDTELAKLKDASFFSKLYARALEYVLMRPRSSKEVRDYLRKKTLDRTVRIKNPKTGEYRTAVKAGYDPTLVPLVMKRLEQHGYIDDARFASVWIENRYVRKGISQKKLRLELQQKGIESSIIDSVLRETTRDERDELKKIIARKKTKYADQQKLIQYLLRQGFNYSDVVDVLSVESSSV